MEQDVDVTKLRLCNYLLELIRISIGSQKALSQSPASNDWLLIYEEALKQSVAGLVIVGIQKIVNRNLQEINLPIELFLQWFGTSEQIKNKNIELNSRCIEISHLFEKAGFQVCILKGQGNALMYSNPYSRTPGDIDLWVRKQRKEVKQFVSTICKEYHDSSKHIEFKFFGDVCVEVHYTPSTLRIPKYNKRLQSFFNEQGLKQFDNKVCFPNIDGSACIPDASFNVIMQLSHIMSHFFVEGIGLRQFVDYYYVLMTLTEEKRQTCDWREKFDCFGMLKFARGVMWIEMNYLGLKKEFLLVEPDAKIGNLILKEILEGGNFGYYDVRYDLRKKGYFARNVVDILRLARLSWYFPGDCFWKVLKDIEGLKYKMLK